MRKLGFALLLIVAAPAQALDGDMEQRCRDIDASGGANSCVCSEPLITSGTWSPGFWNPPGSTTKQCGGGNGGAGKAFYITGAQAGTGIVPPAYWYAVPQNSGIPYVFLLNSNGGSAPNTFMGKLDLAYASVPANVGRVCHRAMFILSPDFVGRNDINNNPAWCTGVKSVEMNPRPFSWGNQFQGGWGSADHCTGTACGGTDGHYYTGNGAGGDNSWTGSNFQMTECKGNWCAIEQCWFGDFSTGAIKPIVRRYAVNSSGSVVINRVSTWKGTLNSNAATPVTIDADRILNLFKQDVCPGSMAIAYGMEAFFATADDGTSEHGPWIGPPAEFTGGGGGGQVLGTPGKPFPVP
jgi:hypothetical protein